MATVNDNYKIAHMFPQAYAIYRLEMTDDEKNLLRKYCYDDEFMRSFEENPGIDPTDPAGFQVNYTRQNLLHRNPDFASLKKAISDINHHFCTVVNHNDLPDKCKLEICDSWIVRSQGDPNYGQNGFHGMNSKQGNGWYSKEHCHAFSVYSGVLYLNEEPSEQGFYFAKDQPSQRVFTWDKNSRFKSDEWSSTHHEIYPEYGMIIMFESSIKHGLIISDNPNDVRYSLVWNTWPHGYISTGKSGQINTDDFQSTDI